MWMPDELKSMEEKGAKRVVEEPIPSLGIRRQGDNMWADERRRGSRCGTSTPKVFLWHIPTMKIFLGVNKANLPRCAMDADFFDGESFAPI
jgi:hypothetical protein